MEAERLPPNCTGTPYNEPANFSVYSVERTGNVAPQWYICVPSVIFIFLCLRYFKLLHAAVLFGFSDVWGPLTSAPTFYLLLTFNKRKRIFLEYILIDRLYSSILV